MLKTAQKSLFCARLLAGLHLALAANLTFAAGMVPETSVVIIDESEGEATLNVKNTDSAPALLYSSIQTIDEDTEQLIVLTPPVARLEGGATQSVRFLMHAAVPLKEQRLRRVTFEGIVPKDNSGGMTIGMNVRQNIPVIINPKGLKKDREPWRHLKPSIKDGRLQIENPSPYVVRLGQGINLLPSMKAVALKKLYILPRQTLTIDLPTGSPTGTTGVRLFPATVYGYAVNSYDVPLSR